MGLASGQARTNAELGAAGSKLSPGTCMGVDWSTSFASVNVDGGTVEMPMVGVAPAVGDKVWVAFLANQPICLGPAPKATTGTIAAVLDGGKVDVEGDDSVLYRSLGYDNAYEPAAPHRVAIDWSIPGGFVLGRLSSDAPDPVVPVNVPDAAGGASTLKDATFIATDSGSFYIPGSKWQSQDVYTGDSNIGAFFYEGIASTIPDSAVIKSVRLYVDSYKNSGGAPSLGLHSLTGKGASEPAVSDAVSVTGGTGWKDLPLSFGDSLKTGAALGLATHHGGEHRWSAARVQNSGALYVSWEVS